MNARFLIFCVIWSAATQHATAQSNIHPDQHFNWSENAGWMNWRDAEGGAAGVFAGVSHLSGYIWAENVGWINLGDGTPESDCGGTPCYKNLDDTDFGVNVNPDGDLKGFAWGENIGWVNFGGGAAANPSNPARVDFCSGELSGYAWAENIGWMNLDDVVHFVALGPCAPGDYDCNGAFDLDDYSFFAEFLDGPDGDSTCAAFDIDDDGDVDLFDFALIQSEFAT